MLGTARLHASHMYMYTPHIERVNEQIIVTFHSG
jgi:hypothetical protein